MKIKFGFAGRNILSDLPPVPNSDRSGKISESVSFQYSHDVEATGSKKVTKSHDIIRGARPKEIETDDQCDIDEEAKDVDDPYMTIPTSVATSATRKKENLSEITTLARKAFDGMEIIGRSSEGEADWTY